MDGKKRGAADFYKLLESFKFDDTFSFSSMENGHLMYKFFTEKKNKVATVNYFADKIVQLNKDAFRLHLRRIFSDVERFKKCLSHETQWLSLTSLLHQKYPVPVVCNPAPLPLITTALSDIVASPPTPPIDDVARSVSTPPTPINDSTVVSVPTPTSLNYATPSRKLRSDCRTCQRRRLQMAHLSEKNSHMKELVKQARLRIATNKALKQKVMRKEELEVSLRKERKSLRRKVKSLESVNQTSLKSVITSLKRSLQAKARELANAHQQIRQQASTITNLEKEVKELNAAKDYLLSVVEEKDETEYDTTINVCKNKLRKVLYRSLLCNVPVAHSGALLSYTLEEFGDMAISKVPHKSTVARMAYEISALSSIQAAETLLKSNCATLCWDATTLDGTHVNEVHVSSPAQTFTISLARLPGGRAIDYVDQITAAVDELAATYAAYTGDVYHGVKYQILSKISSTMSDRAPVNHCVVQQLRAAYETDLLELNCNLHPLDGFASHTRTALQKLDREEGMTTSGRDCCAASFIYSISKLRYKQTGDPSGFKAFLKEHDIPPGTFVRYVGNRLHVMFHLAGVIIRYRLQLKDYLERYCRNVCRTDLLSLLADDRLVAQLRALGLCGKYLTGPWMTIFYGNINRLSNLDMVPYIKTSFENVNKALIEPSFLFTTPTDAFGQNLQEDRVLSSLREIDSTSLTTKYLSVILGACHKVMSSQLQEYLSGSLSSPTDAMLMSVKSASPHNIWAERSLGMADALWRRAPNASVGFLDAKVKAKYNHTLEWLDSQDSPAQEQLIKFAIKRGSVLRSSNFKHNKCIDKTVQLRLTELAQSREKKKRNLLEKEIRKALKESTYDNPVFDPIEGSQKPFLRLLFECSQSLIGALFRHTWETTDGNNEVFWARIHEISPAKKTRSSLVTVGYWSDGQQESSSEDYDLNAEAMIADMVTRDLTFA